MRISWFYKLNWFCFSAATSRKMAFNQFLIIDIASIMLGGLKPEVKIPEIICYTTVLTSCSPPLNLTCLRICKNIQFLISWTSLQFHETHLVWEFLFSMPHLLWTKEGPLPCHHTEPAQNSFLLLTATAPHRCMMCMQANLPMVRPMPLFQPNLYSHHFLAHFKWGCCYLHQKKM